jgi:protein involved in polysaccharide export with SLBB domain
LKAGNLELQRKRGVLEAAEIKMNQVAEVRAQGGDLKSLAFVANQPLVAKLSETLAGQRIERAKLFERYRDKHPIVIQTTNAMAATERELQSAIDSYCRQLESERNTAVAEYQQQKVELQSLMEQSLDLDRQGVRQVQVERQLAARNQLAEVAAQPAREEAGERVSIPATRETRVAEDRFEVSVVGAVNTQSAVTVSGRDNPIVLDAIARAGGFATNANRDAVRLIRSRPDGNRETVTLTEALVMAGTDPAVRLQRGDVIVVPERSNALQFVFVNVSGAVNQAGRVPMPSNHPMTLVHAITAAGGQSRLADLKKVQLTRAKTEVRIIDVLAILKGSSDDIMLEANDTVFVPERIL